MSYIEIRDLHYQYENGTRALKGLNLTVEKGEIFGFLGSNGAGKSTTFKILVGLLEPERGEALIDGKSIGHQERKIYAKVGYMPDDTDIYDDYTVAEFLRFFGLCHGMTRKAMDERCADLMRRFELEHKEKVLMSDLSKGERQKACVIRTMIHSRICSSWTNPLPGWTPLAAGSS